MRRALGLAAVTCVGLACESNRPAGPVPPIAERATVDRPDDISGSQIHVVYAVCGDCVDDALDLDGTIEDLVFEAREWFRQRAGGATLRFDTFEERLDITYAFIPGRDVDLLQQGSGLVNLLAERLGDLGLDATRKSYLIFYDGRNDRTCGSAQFGLGYAAQYLQARLLRPCDVSALSALHETLHAMGFVDADAPNHDALRPGHVKGSLDLMSGTVLGTELDPGRNDYYGPAVPDDVQNLMKSPFVDEPDDG